jgi:hypothetical protein
MWIPKQRPKWENSPPPRRKPIWSGNWIEVYSYLGATRMFYLYRNLRTNKISKSFTDLTDVLDYIDDPTDQIRFTAWLKERGL